VEIIKTADYGYIVWLQAKVHNRRLGLQPSLYACSLWWQGLWRERSIFGNCGAI